jgi:hypothetical protein
LGLYTDQYNRDDLYLRREPVYNMRVRERLNSARSATGLQS